MNFTICMYKVWNLLMLQHKYAQNMLSIFPFMFIGSDHPYRSPISFSESHSWLSSIFNWEMSNGRFHYYHTGKLFSAVYAVFYGTCSLVSNSVCLVMIPLLFLCISICIYIYICGSRPVTVPFICSLHLVYLTLWYWKKPLVNTQRDAEETEPHLKVSGKNKVKGGQWNIMSFAQYTGHINSGTKGLILLHCIPILIACGEHCLQVDSFLIVHNSSVNHLPEIGNLFILFKS
jgi:hypothetical protein